MSDAKLDLDVIAAKLPQSYVLVGVDDSERAVAASVWAAAEAQARSVPLVIAAASDATAAAVGFNLTASESFYQFLDGRIDDALAAAKEAVTQSNPSVRVATVSAGAKPVDLLVGLSQRAEVTVVGATGAGGFSRLLIGSVAQGVARRAASPVAVVRGSVAPEGTVVVGVDGSEVGVPAVRFAFEYASARGHSVTAIHAWSDVPVTYAAAFATAYGIDWEAEEQSERAILAENLAGYATDFPEVEIKRLITRGDAAGSLVDLSAGANLVVVGSHGRGTVGSYVLGSVSNHVMTHAECPVLVVRDRR